jgi:hypothetical protein
MVADVNQNVGLLLGYVCADPRQMIDGRSGS